MRGLSGGLWLLAACANTANSTAGVGMDAALDARVDASDARIVADAILEDVPPPPPPPPFRLRSPISNHAIATSRPILRWFSPSPEAEHVVTICEDRRCTTVQDRQTVRGLTAQPTRDLPRGLHYWFVSTTRDGATVETPVWMFRTTWATDAEPRTDDRGSAPDYNGDGFSDIVVRSNALPSPEVIYGGSGPLMRTPIPAGSSPEERVVQLCGAADFNGDGYDDLAVWVSSGQGYVSAVLLGSEAGLSGQRRVYTPPRTPVMRRINSVRYDLRRGDLDQDGYEDLVDTDIVYGVLFDKHVRLIWGGAAQISWERRSDGEDDGAVIFDINADGVPDLISMQRLLGPGFRTSLGPLERRASWTYSARREVTDITFCDIDHDRVPDLFGTNLDDRFPLHGITGWLRRPDGRETMLEPLVGKIRNVGCIATGATDRLIFSDFLGHSLNGISLDRPSASQSRRLSANALVEPMGLPRYYYGEGPMGSFAVDRDTQSMVITRDGAAGYFVDVMSVESGGFVVTVDQSVRLQDLSETLL